jgi:hypothetical protein
MPHPEPPTGTVAAPSAQDGQLGSGANISGRSEDAHITHYQQDLEGPPLPARKPRYNAETAEYEAVDVERTQRH